MEKSVRKRTLERVALMATVTGALFFFGNGCKTYQKTVNWVTPTKPAPILSSREGVVPAPYDSPAATPSKPEQPAAPGTSGGGSSMTPLDELSEGDVPPELADEKPDIPETQPQEDEGEGVPEPGEAETQELTHTVQKGESLWKIGQKYDVSFKELAAYNNMDPDEVLSVGTKLKIPPGGTAPDGTSSVATTGGGSTSSGGGGSSSIEKRPLPPDNKYTVQKGDSLWRISRMFDVPMDRIRSLNDLQSDTLQIGQVLVLKKGGNGSSQATDTSSDSDEWDDTSDFETGGGEESTTESTTEETTSGDSEATATAETTEEDTSGGEEENDYSFPKTLQHKVGSDESLKMIADMYDTSPEKIIKANDTIQSSEDLESGMNITVPYE